MCLRTRQKEPLIAKEDIVAYKIAIKVGIIYYSYFQHFPYTLNADYEETEEGEITKIGDLYSIGNGWIHCYQDIPFHYTGTKILKCIIPKGTLYYIRITGDICSKRLIIVKEVRLVASKMMYG